MEELLNKINDRKDEISKAELSVFEKNMKKLEPYMTKFLVENNYIVTDLMFIKEIDKKSFDQIIDEYKEKYYYYTVFINQTSKKCVELVNELYQSKKFEYLELRQSSRFTYELKIDFNVYAQFIALHSKVFESFETVTFNNNNIRYLHPDFQRIFIYKIYTNPRQKIDRWVYASIHENALNNVYPLQLHDNFRIKPQEMNKIITKLDDQYIKDNKNIILIGTLAYRKLLNKTNVHNLLMPNIDYIELLTPEPEKEIEKIKKIIGNKSKVSKDNKSKDNKNKVSKDNDNKLTVYYDKQTFFNKRISIMYEQKKIIEIYDSSHDCLPYNVVDKVNIGNLHVLLTYFYIKKVLTKSKFFESMIINLIKMANEYMKKNNLIGIETTPMKIFQLTCFGEQLDENKQTRIDLWSKKIYISNYKPEIFYSKHNKLLD